MPANKPVEPVQWMTNRLLAWLRDDDAKQETLVDWLQGYGLPGADRDEHTFLWIVRAIPLGADRHATRQRLAERVARLLDSEPDVRPPGAQPERLLTNLFLLCANLRVREKLARPLYLVFQRHRKGKDIPKHLTLVVLDSLRDALAENQADNRLQPVWEIMIKGGKHPLLPGDPLDAWRGFVGMPSNLESFGQPSLDAAGEALAALAVHVEDMPQRNALFREAIDAFCERFKGSRILERALIEQADSNHWPTWAIRKLPTHFLILEDSNEVVVAYASDQLLQLISVISEHHFQENPSTDRPRRVPSFIERFFKGGMRQNKTTPTQGAKILTRLDGAHFGILKQLCAGRIAKVKLLKTIAICVEEIAPRLTQKVRLDPYRSERSAWGIYGDALEEIKLDSHFRGDQCLESALEQALPHVREFTLNVPQR